MMQLEYVAMQVSIRNLWVHTTRSSRSEAFVFEMPPRVPVAVLYWEGDDEFPTESKILNDNTNADHLALDIIYALTVGICERLGKVVR